MAESCGLGRGSVRTEFQTYSVHGRGRVDPLPRQTFPDSPPPPGPSAVAWWPARRGPCGGCGAATGARRTSGRTSGRCTSVGRSMRTWAISSAACNSTSTRALRCGAWPRNGWWVVRRIISPNNPLNEFLTSRNGCPGGRQFHFARTKERGKTWPENSSPQKLSGDFCTPQRYQVGGPKSDPASECTTCCCPGRTIT